METEPPSDPSLLTLQMTEPIGATVATEAEMKLRTHSILVSQL